MFLLLVDTCMSCEGMYVPLHVGMCMSCVGMYVPLHVDAYMYELCGYVRTSSCGYMCMSCVGMYVPLHVVICV